MLSRCIFVQEVSDQLQGLIEGGREADLLIVEAIFFGKIIRKHLDYHSLRSNLDRIAPKSFILTHLGPGMLAGVGEVDCGIVRDGMIIELDAA